MYFATESPPKNLMASSGAILKVAPLNKMDLIPGWGGVQLKFLVLATAFVYRSDLYREAVADNSPGSRSAPWVSS